MAKDKTVPTKDNLHLWNKWCAPPQDALKAITGGRLQGMTDISPIWRFKALTEQFGPCGEGWGYSIVELWTVPGASGEVTAFARVDLWLRHHADPAATHSFIQGIGGAKMISNERNGLHTDDDCYKKAVTDAISVAAKALGVGANIYAGHVEPPAAVAVDVRPPHYDTGPGSVAGTPPPTAVPEATNGTLICVACGLPVKIKNTKADIPAYWCTGGCNAEYGGHICKVSQRNDPIGTRKLAVRAGPVPSTMTTDAVPF